MAKINRKILLLSTGDVNGAYEAIYRLADPLSNQGHQVKMLVKAKTKSDNFIVEYRETQSQSAVVRVALKVLEKINRKFFIKKNDAFDKEYDFISVDETKKNIDPSQIIKQIGFIPEYIFVGMTNDFMNSTDLLNLQQLTNAQVYNITVDMNHFTGGCHYAWDCEGYIKGCDKNCPAIVDKRAKGIAKKNFETKLKNAKKGNFKIIAGSQWTINQAKKSKIYSSQKEIVNVNSLIDTSFFNSRNRDIAKKVFDLKEDKFYILMGCQNANRRRKGFEYLVEALTILETKISDEQKNKIEVLIVSGQVSNKFDFIPFDKKFIEFVKDYRLLKLLYQASDVFVNSSIEDSGPMMVSEALACGTPVVGFDMGIVNNMVISDYNGYKAKLKDSNDLAIGIKKILDLSEEEYNQYSLNAVRQVEELSSLKYAEKVLADLLNE